MKSEFDKIIEYFSMKPEDRAVHLEEILQDSVHFFERFKYVMQQGSPEEKKEIIEKIKILQKMMQEETQKVCQQMGMSEEDMKNFIANPANFSKEQWEVIQTAKGKIESEAKEINETLKAGGGEKKEEKKPKKPKGKRKDWMAG